MTICIRRCASFDEERRADAEFWRQFSPDERVALLEEMRQEWLVKNGRRDEGLRRTVRVTALHASLQ
jgi:hypothetical protein